jgi:hypothetical protein
VGLVLLMIGLMGEFYTRRHASISWNARQPFREAVGGRSRSGLPCAAPGQ